MHSFLSNKWTKVSIFLLCLVPFGILGWRALTGNLGPNPVEFLQHATGDWTLRFLVFTLCITPLRKLLKLPDLIRFRRMLGLFAFFYACLHFLTYLGPDQNFDLSGNVEGRLQTPVHHRRLYRLCPADSAGPHFYCRMDSSSWRTPLANAPSCDLYQRDLWRDSLLLAGEIRGLAAADLRSNRRCPLALAIGRLVDSPRTHHRGRAQNAARFGKYLVNKV